MVLEGRRIVHKVVTDSVTDFKTGIYNVKPWQLKTVLVTVPFIPYGTSQVRLSIEHFSEVTHETELSLFKLPLMVKPFRVDKKNVLY